MNRSHTAVAVALFAATFAAHAQTNGPNDAQIAAIWASFGPLDCACVANAAAKRTTADAVRIRFIAAPSRK